MRNAAWGDETPALTKRLTAVPRAVADGSRPTEQRVAAGVATVVVPSVVATGAFEALHAVSPWAAGELSEHVGWVGQTALVMTPAVLMSVLGSFAPPSSDPRQARARRRNRAIYRGIALAAGAAAVVATGADIACAATHAGHIVGTLDRDATGLASISAVGGGLAVLQRRGISRDVGLSE